VKFSDLCIERLELFLLRVFHNARVYEISALSRKTWLVYWGRAISQLWVLGVG